MKKKIFGILAGMLILAGALTPTWAFAGECGGTKLFGLDPWYAKLQCEADGKTVSQSNFSTDAKGNSKLLGTILLIVGTVVKDLLFAAGVIAVAMVIVGGVQYILSAGNPAAVAKATKTITASLTGLIIAIFAYAIATTVMSLVAPNKDSGSTSVILVEEEVKC